MSLKIQYSSTYDAKRKRIQRLPKLIENAISGYTKRDLLEIKRIFHDGIKNNTLHLERLTDATIDSKRAKGYSKPKSPLYGKGDKEKIRSYSNMLEVIKSKNGWKLQPSRKLHWSKKIRLSDLFKIHEHGATIKQKRGDTEVFIKIPPRPALLLSYRRFLINKRKDKKEQSKEVKQAMTEYINKGNEKKLNDLKKWVDKVEKNYR